MSPSTESTATPSDLEAPLLEKLETVNLVEEDLSKPNAPSSSLAILDETKSSLNVLSTGTGVFIGLMSQVVLSLILWDQTILDHPMRHLLLFSLGWSLLSCLIVNCFMAVFVRDMKTSFYRIPNPEGDDNVWSETASTMEAFVIGGALVSISAWWLVLDMGAVHLPLATSSVVGLVMVSTVIYIFFISMTMPGKNGIPAWWNCLIASILGLVLGFGSQTSLSAFFWTGLVPKPALSNLFVFSLIWSGCTILVTFLGCMALRYLKPDDKSLISSERAYLRMESFYVLSSLVGISFAWISLDIVLGLTQQIVPSVLMLIVSLLLFRFILYCFPEEKCLEEFEKDNADALANKLLP